MEPVMTNLREYLRKKNKGRERVIDELKDNDNFFEKKILDSFELIQFFLHIEKTYKINIEIEDYVKNRLETLQSIEQYIHSKRVDA